MPSASKAYTVSQLAAQASIPVARIKFYLREGLLPGGDLGAPRRAYYDGGHLTRLRLIHALRGVAGLSVPAVAELCARLDRRADRDRASAIAHVLDALGTRKRRAATSAAERRAHRELFGLLRSKGMRVRPDARALTDLARALAALRTVIDPRLPVSALEPYLQAMCQLAERDFAATASLLTSGADAALAATLGTVLWEPVLVLSRRLAHEHVARQRLSPRKARR